MNTCEFAVKKCCFININKMHFANFSSEMLSGVYAGVMFCKTKLTRKSKAGWGLVFLLEINEFFFPKLSFLKYYSFDD